MKLGNNKLFRSIVKAFPFLVFAVIVCTGFPAPRQIHNPYQSVDWAKYGQYKANLHTHTMVSDGWMNPQTVVEKYRERGYRILAITDHRTVTYPWQQFSRFKISTTNDRRMKQGTRKPQEDQPIAPGDAEFKDLNPSETGMVAIQAGELWFKKHELNCFFTDYSGPDTEGFFDILSAKGGIAFLNHPGRYKLPTEWYVDIFQQYRHLAGFEVFNCGNRYPNDRRLWDSILAAMISVRPVWGFSNDDMHSLRDLGRNWNVFLLPEANQENVRHAMENGIFYILHAPKGHKGVPAPRIRSIRVDEKKGIIQIKASGQVSIAWISNGEIVHRGKKFPINKLPAGGKYVRAELHGAGDSIVCTQPFYIP